MRQHSGNRRNFNKADKYAPKFDLDAPRVTLTEAEKVNAALLARYVIASAATQELLKIFGAVARKAYHRFGPFPNVNGKATLEDHEQTANFTENRLAYVRKELIDLGKLEAVA